MSKIVLIAPLHWGLGHATRCVPLVRNELEAGNRVIIAAEDAPRVLLQEHFPDLEYVRIPFMPITYPRDGNMVRHFVLNGPRLLHSIWREHRTLQAMVKAHKIDMVISDSRFGLWSGRAYTVFVTHQVEIKSPRLHWLVNALNRWVMARYDEVWIPDYEAAPGLAGELSHPNRLPKNARYIGPLSRFTGKLGKKEKPKWKAVVLVSGPEPHRSLFEAEMARRFIESGEPALMLCGKPSLTGGESRHMGNLRMENHLHDSALLHELAQCETVIARSGYSTIMDLHALGLTAEWHPTPGQTEQEYLAGLHFIGS